MGRGAVIGGRRGSEEDPAFAAAVVVFFGNVLRDPGDKLKSGAICSCLFVLQVPPLEKRELHLVTSEQGGPRLSIRYGCGSCSGGF